MMRKIEAAAVAAGMAAYDAIIGSALEKAGCAMAGYRKEGERWRKE
jgi:hypothetical protein